MWTLRKGQPRLWHVQGQRRDGGREAGTERGHRRETHTHGETKRDRRERESNRPGTEGEGETGTERGKGRERGGQREGAGRQSEREPGRGGDTHRWGGMHTQTYTHPPPHTPREGGRRRGWGDPEPEVSALQALRAGVVGGWRLGEGCKHLWENWVLSRSLPCSNIPGEDRVPQHGKVRTPIASI